jgi:hypothetical protein
MKRNKEGGKIVKKKAGLVYPAFGMASLDLFMPVYRFLCPRS